MVCADAFDHSIVEQIELRMIRPSSSPVRYADPKDSKELADLKASIQTHGLLQPIIVRPLEHGFEIVAGHRRHAACRSLRWRFIPCKIYELTDRQAFEIQITENVHRKSMDPIEEAEAYQKYVMDFGWGGVSELGKRLGKSEEYISHRLQLLKLPPQIKEQVVSKRMSISQALELTTMASRVPEETISGIAEDIVNNKLTIKQIRGIKSQIREEPGLYEYQRQSRSKEHQIVRKCILTMKITLSRIDELIHDAHKADPKDRAALVQFLMEMRREAHSMIDDAIKYKKSKP